VSSVVPLRVFRVCPSFGWCPPGRQPSDRPSRTRASTPGWRPRSGELPKGLANSGSGFGRCRPAVSRFGGYPLARRRVAQALRLPCDAVRAKTRASHSAPGRRGEPQGPLRRPPKAPLATTRSDDLANPSHRSGARSGTPTRAAPPTPPRRPTSAPDAQPPPLRRWRSCPAHAANDSRGNRTGSDD
jgi:hypothetical protein